MRLPGQGGSGLRRGPRLRPKSPRAGLRQRVMLNLPGDGRKFHPGVARDGCEGYECGPGGFRLAGSGPILRGNRSFVLRERRPADGGRSASRGDVDRSPTPGRMRAHPTRVRDPVPPAAVRPPAAARLLFGHDTAPAGPYEARLAHWCHNKARNVDPAARTVAKTLGHRRANRPKDIAVQ